MRSTTFHAALLAAARVAGCAALVACRPPLNTGYTGPIDGGGTVAGDSAYEPLETGYGSDSSTVPKSDAQCESYLDDTFEGWDWSTPVDDLKDNATVVGCCEQLGTTADAEQSWDFPHREPCCTILDWQGPMACTPWGPPRPPAFPEVT